MASGKTSIRVEVEDYTPEVIKEKDEAVKRVLNKIGLLAERYASETCPVQTGRLRASITYTYQGQSSFRHEYTDDDGKGFHQDVGAAGDEPSVYVGTNVEYAPSVELGDGAKRKPRHFLKKAMENHIGEYKELIEKELG